MKYKFQIQLFLIFFSYTINAQNVIIKGNLRPGELLVGYTDSLQSVLLDSKPLKSSDGVFIFGFDRDAKGIHYLKLMYKNGKEIIKKLKLKKRKYKIQRINKIKKKYVKPPKSEITRITEERKKIKKARRIIEETDSLFYLSGFKRPVKGGRLTSIFGSQRILNGVPKNPHNGLDIASPRGTPVYAMADGIVRLVGHKFFYNGNFVLIDHGQGLNSIYLHFRKTFVKDGQFVKKGEEIGEIGTTGRSTGPHLHWGVQWYNKRIDPAGILKLNKSITLIRSKIKTINHSHKYSKGG
ncbi:murein DD-endopeptidase MepM [bacterium BMS3Abin04]|nr:murein DD-endopeptidase MepM [bacterium BMS3Abin04]